MKIICRVIGAILILMAVATAFKSFTTTDFYYYSFVEILGEYFVYVVLALVGILLIMYSLNLLSLPKFISGGVSSISSAADRGNLKQKIIIGASAVSVLMVLYPPKQRLGTTGRVLDQYYGWIFSTSQYSKGVINVPMLALQLAVVGFIALGLLYAFKDSTKWK